MAKNTDITNAVNSGVNQITQGMDGVADSIEDLSTAVGNLGDGLKLSKKNEVKQDNDKKSDDLSKQLKGLGDFCENWRDMLELLLDINIQVEKANLLTESRDAESTKNVVKDVQIKDSHDVKDLAGLTEITDITASGFTILGNILSDLNTTFSEILTSISTGDVAKEFTKSLAPVSIDEAKKTEDKDKDKGKENKGLLKSFFEGIGGPLESITGSLVMLALAATVLSTIGFNSDLLLTMISFTTFFVVTFAALSFISIEYQKHKQLLSDDKNKKDSGSPLSIITQFAIMIGLVNATMLMCAGIVTFMTNNWPQVLTGLAIVFGATFISLIALNLTAVLITKLVGADKPKDMPINKLMTAFVTMVGMIVALSVVCALAWDLIEEGLGNMQLIMNIAMITIIEVASVMMIASKLGVTAMQIDAFQQLLKTITVLIGVIAILTIVLGIIPEPIIQQGIITIGLIVGMISLLLGMLTLAITKMKNVDEGKLKALMGILIITTVMIALISILVIVLGMQDIGVLTAGLLMMMFISTIPIILIKLMTKIANQASNVAKALVGVALAAVVVIAVAAVAWVIISMLGQFTLTQVLTTMAAMLSVSILMIAMAGFIIVMGTVYGSLIMGPQAALIPLALVGIAIAAVFAVAVAGVAVLISNILTIDRARTAIIGAMAIILTATALAMIAGCVLLLAAAAIPLVFATALALVAVACLVKFLSNLTTAVFVIGFIGTILQSLGTDSIKDTTDAIITVLQSLVPMAAAIIAFGVIALTLALGLYTATFGLISFTFSFIFFSLAYVGFVNVVNKLSAKISDKTASMEFLTQAITTISDFSKQLNTFTAPNAEKLKAVDNTMDFIKKFAKKFGQLGSDGNISRVTTLANSLSELAKQATGLTELAEAMTAVADASSKLQDLPNKDIGKGNLENLTGGKTSAAQIEPIPTNKAEKSDKGNDEIVKLLQLLIEKVGNVDESLREYNANRNMQDRTAASKEKLRPVFMSED